MNNQSSSSSSSSSEESTTRHPFEVPEDYKLMQNLEHGSCGFVPERMTNNTEEHEAIKVSERNCQDHEVKILKKPMSHNSKEKDRTPPSDILDHPSITRSDLSSNSPTSSCDESRPSTTVSIMVKPADPENRINLTGLPDDESDLKSSKLEDSDTAKDTENNKDNDEDTEVKKKAQRKTKTKKKNYFQCAFSWIKKKCSGFCDKLKKNIQSSSSSSSEESTTSQRSEVSTGYTFVKEIGHGGFALVVECVKNDTEEHVAVKVPEWSNLDHEAEIMKKLVSHNSKQSNIIDYKGDIFIKNKRQLVFEKLDISLWDYLRNSQQPMPLEHVRTIIEQLAVALDTTKSAGIIHADLKEDNIMMVDRVKQPFRVKLIDFGEAEYSSKTKAGKLLQVVAYRAPEIILGLPYSEAIDIWSLGCVMERMMTSDGLFGTDSEYWTLLRMIGLLGVPPQHVIDAGRRSELFFQKMPDGLWQLKRPTECFGTHFDDAVYQFSSLDEIETVCSETDNLAEADERKECIELLKAMLQWDEKDRITPSGILKHPFITRSYLSSNSPTSSCDEPRPSTSLSITVKPADPENRINLTGLPDDESDLKSSKLEDSDTAKDTETSKDRNNDEDTKGNEKDQRRTKTKKKNCFERIFSWRKKTFCCCCCVQV
ncbi:homeodomain-interacting protein kinase 1-like [Acanthochromis polyacanthus]|uniref:homeodomain-interacting protein kinase 1-like n=2 Tax=Acanthochromis polyacanthus TaxID=80966 RepID=UPI0022340E0D|nr:homeodomain-interacting protein kinase 1-like [Acanthochromis polyacanthus]